jgi:K(+)-stimulated pyrophosphate-energized sodium pump
VALLIAPAVVGLTVGNNANTVVRVLIALAAVLIIIGSVVVSKRRSVVVGGNEETAPRLRTSTP